MTKERNMGNKWLKIILAASLALNLAVLSTYIYKNVFHQDRKSEHIVKFDAKLKLQKKQKEEIDAVIKKFRIDKLKFKQDILEKRMDIIDELGAPAFDLENINTEIGELNELENQLNLEFVDTMVQVTNILDSKQRLDFLYKLSENWFFIERRRR
jgi:Spy/CpxP family protein refolding chaperone